MKKLMTVLTAVTLAVAVAATSASAAEKAGKGKKEKKTKSQQLTGIITSVDTEKNTVVVEKKGTSKTFTCDETTKVLLANKAAGAVADLTQGLKVKVVFAAQDDTAVCKTITILPAKEKKSKSKKNK